MNIEQIDIDTITPTIHINGDSIEYLAQEWHKFRQALDNAMDAFPYHSFHGRNHYVCPEEDQQHTAEAHVALRSAILLAMEISDDVINNLTQD